MTPTEFFAIPNGTQVYNHGADQCVALANEFNEGVIGAGFIKVDSAFQWWTDYSSNQILQDNYTQVTDTPQYGDLFIGRYGFYDAPNGHIGVVARSWDGSSFGTMEQNTGKGDMRYVWRHNRTMANILGFLRPRNQELFNPVTPSINFEDKNMMLCHTMEGRTPEQGPLYLLFSDVFYIGFGGPATQFEAQIGGPSMPVSLAFQNSVRAFIDSGRK